MAFFPLMPFGILSIVSIGFVLLSIVVFKDNISKNFVVRKKTILINISFYLIISLTVFLSNDKMEAFKIIKRDLNILIFPLIILLFFPNLLKNEIKKILNTYLLSSIIVLFIFISVIIKYAYLNNHLVSFFNFPFRNIIEGKTYLDITPTYLGIWFSFSVFYLVQKLLTKASIKIKSIYVILLIGFYFFILISSARTVFLMLNLILVMYLFVASYSLKKKLIVLSSFIIVGCCVFLNLNESSNFKYRYFEEVFKKEIKIPKGRNPSSLSIRYGVYLCGLELVKNNPILGYGIGDVQAKLSECYKLSYRSSVFQKTKFDSHNYFIYLLLSGGIIALLFFVIMFGYNTRLALKNKNYLYLSFLLIIFSCCFTENVLSRAYGSVFFAYLNSIFLLNYHSKKLNNGKN